MYILRYCYYTKCQFKHIEDIEEKTYPTFEEAFNAMKLDYENTVNDVYEGYEGFTKEEVDEFTTFRFGKKTARIEGVDEDWTTHVNYWHIIETKK